MVKKFWRKVRKWIVLGGCSFVVAGFFIMVASLIHHLIDNNKAANIIIAFILVGTFLSYFTAIFDRASALNIEKSFDKHGIMLPKYDENERVKASSIIISASFLTVLFMMASLITVIANKTEIVDAIMSIYKVN